jgi:hypothetical protein
VKHVKRNYRVQDKKEPFRKHLPTLVYAAGLIELNSEDWLKFMKKIFQLLCNI